MGGPMTPCSDDAFATRQAEVGWSTVELPREREATRPHSALVVWA